MRINVTYKFVIMQFFFAVSFVLPQSGIEMSQGKIDRIQRQAIDELEKASDRLYSESLKTFEKGKYWETARDLIILLDFYPDYSKIDQVVFTLGDCLYEIELHEGAAKLYKHLVKKYIRSPLLPRALLGLQKIEYVKGDNARCIEFFNAINRAVPDESILNASKYFAGLSFYSMKDYPRTVELLSSVSDKSPYFAFGQYSLGLSLLRLKQVRKAIEIFQNITHLPVISDDLRSVIDESHLTLGYIYYELGYYKQALNEFQSVSPIHSSYADALLAAGWSATQLDEYDQAIKPLTSLIGEFPDTKTNEEAFFLLGRCYLKLARYDEALTVYEHLIEVFPDRDVIPSIINEINKNLATEGVKIEKIKMDLLVLETKLLDLIPLESQEVLPDYIQEEKQRIAETRAGMLRRIREERDDFEYLSSQMDNLRQTIALKEDRKDWRAYAEYGKSRALFLKRVQ